MAADTMVTAGAGVVEPLAGGASAAWIICVDTRSGKIAKSRSRRMKRWLTVRRIDLEEIVGATPLHTFLHRDTGVFVTLDALRSRPA
ncbi:hypothetical protein [Methylobacterium sp. 10]|uniref:hypothetical protein n=1 Tax=Methylobacterium sp. 10 TaxID=1101191 RepID=UPI001FD8E7A7|nr:hypothetical protein [Methylobacterium sp. 10]